MKWFTAVKLPLTVSLRGRVITDNCLTGVWLQSEIFRTQPAQRSTLKESKLRITFEK